MIPSRPENRAMSSLPAKSALAWSEFELMLCCRTAGSRALDHAMDQRPLLLLQREVDAVTRVHQRVRFLHLGLCVVIQGAKRFAGGHPVAYLFMHHQSYCRIN